MSSHFVGVLFLIYFPIYSIILALCKTCDMPNCLHCVHCSSCHKYIQSPNDSTCYSNQQQPKTSTSFTCSACVSSTIPFFNLTKTELYSLFLFDNSDLSNFIEPFPCDLSDRNFQTKYSTLNDTGKMNHASKQKNLSYFHFIARSLGKNKHKLDDFFLMTEATPTFIAISKTKLKSNYILNVDIPGFNFIHNPSQTNSGGVGLYINYNLTYQPRNDLNLNNAGCESLFIEIPTSSGKPFITGAIYRHPTYAFPPFQDEFVKLVTHLQNNNYDYLIGGDYNINLIKYQENSNVSNYVDCLANCGCILLSINQPDSAKIQNHLY